MMDAPTPGSPHPTLPPARLRWLRPSVSLPVIAILLLITVLLTPDTSTTGDQRYSTYSAEPGGVRGLYDVLRRVHYPVARRLTSMSDSVSSNAIYVVLPPAVPLSTSERNELIAAVRNGAGLIFSGDQRLADSLGFLVNPTFGLRSTFDLSQSAGGNPPVDVPQTTTLPVPIGNVAALSLTRPMRRHDDKGDSVESNGDTVLEVIHRAPDDRASFLWLTSTFDAPSDRDSTTFSGVVIGVTVGKGRAVVISDATILRNAWARDGRPIYAILRAVDWINAKNGNTLPVVFDEYHQGFGKHANIPAAIGSALTETPLGRTTVQLSIAALVLLFAIGIRVIPPVASARITRRSPLEHVDALAYAYEQTDAKTLATDRLIRGLRRRHSLGIPRTAANDVYLDRLRTRVPQANPEIDRLLSFSQGQPDTSRDDVAVAGAAVARIETLIRS